VANTGKPQVPPKSKVQLELEQLDVGSAVALVGHPLHVMMVHFPVAFVFATLGIDVLYWWSGDAFWLRSGIWSAGTAFWTGVGASGLELSVLGSVMVGFAGWHGGKLVFDHGIGILVSPSD
jgi:uncharacterized membrane protein